MCEVEYLSMMCGLIWLKMWDQTAAQSCHPFFLGGAQCQAFFKDASSQGSRSNASCPLTIV